MCTFASAEHNLAKSGDVSSLLASLAASGATYLRTPDVHEGPMLDVQSNCMIHCSSWSIITHLPQACHTLGDSHLQMLAEAV